MNPEPVDASPRRDADASEPRVSLGPSAAPESPRPLRVVGVGASAGGLRPLENFFRAMPSDSGLAFVVVQHLSPDYKSLMQELLTRHTTMPVRRADEGGDVQPNTVYVIPPGKTLRFREGGLAVEGADDNQHPRFVIDTFFTSLAHELEERAIGVILSGSGTDGARGVRAIHERGGLVLVQEPTTAEFDGMPRAAIQSGLVDAVRAPDGLAELIYDYATKAHGPLQRAQSDDPLIPPTHLQRIVELLAREEEVDFNHYRPLTLSRRIERRRLLSGDADLDAFIRRLEASREARQTLCSDLLIAVTNFFRDADAWASLARNAIPDVLERAAADGSELRCWVTACSTGEEAYTLAIVLHEAIEQRGLSLAVKIFATDVNEHGLRHAASGLFSRAIANDLPDRLIGRYFHVEGDRFRARPELRKMLIFARHSLTRDAPFTRMHLVTCRNVLIYMQPELQQYVQRLLHYALNVEGVLMLGQSETLVELQREFHTLDSKWRIYRKWRDANLGLPNKPNAARPITVIEAPRAAEQAAEPQSRPSLAEPVLSLLLHRSDSVVIVTDTDKQVLHIFGPADHFLRVPEGDASAALPRMLPASVSIVVNTAMNRAARGHEAVTYRGLDLDQGGGRRIDITVSHRPGTRRVPESLFVLLEPSLPGAPSISDAIAPEAAEQIDDLERELRVTKENLQSTIEELETTNEEQQSTNEELTAANEELQSTNEELQSVNEELHTVNAEHQRKIEELTNLNDDMDNLLRSLDVGVIFLDEQLRIRRFTPAVQAVIPLMEHDIGRPLAHFTHALIDESLLDEVRSVIREGKARTREAARRDGGRTLVRLQPYRTADNAVRGALLSLVDITEWTALREKLDDSQRALHAERELNETRQRFRAALEGSLDCLYLLASTRDDAGKLIDFEILDVNEHGAALVGMSREQMVGARLCELLPVNRTSGFFDKYKHVVETGEPLIESFPIDEPYVHAEWLAHQVVKAGDGVLITTRDVSEQKRIERAVREQRDLSLGLLRGVAAPLIVFDDQLRIVRLSDAAAELCGRRQEDVQGRPGVESGLLERADQEIVRDVLHTMRNSPVQSVRRRYALRTATHASRLIEWRHTLYCDAEGGSCHLIAFGEPAAGPTPSTDGAGV